MITLPIDSLRKKIVGHDGVKIITASFGAGKTLRVPKWLSDRRNEQYLVIPPKRRLAQAGANAMSSVYSDVGHPLRYGYCVQGSTSTYNKHTQVLFTTPGVALYRNLVHTHQNIILDEVQEQSMLHTCISAILKRRMDNGDQIDLTLMSASIDPGPLLEYWKDYNPAVFSCDTMAHVPIIDASGDPIGSIAQLIEDGHQGIIVFVDGERTIREMRHRLSHVSKAMHTPFHISVAHSNMAMSDLLETDSPTAEGCVRILLSTNVSESGVRYRWKPTAVVSTGIGKCLVEKNGVSTLFQTDLTKDRILQQSGRVSDTAPDSVMILHGTPFADRPAVWPSEHSRLPMEYLVKTVISVGEDPRTLDFGPDIKSEDISSAIDRLQALGILTKDDKITESGAFVMSIPDSYRVGLMLYHAQSIGCLNDIILPAIAITAGRFYRQHDIDHSDASPRSIMTLRSIVADIANTWACPRKSIVAYAKQHNISMRSLRDAHNRVTAITAALNVVPTLIRYQTLPPTRMHAFSQDVEECIMAGHVDMVYGVTANNRNKLRCVSTDGKHMTYALHHSPTGDPRQSFLAVANLKTNGVTSTKADAVCMIRSDAVRSYIDRVQLSFRQDNPIHKRLLHIATNCLSGKHQTEFLGMLPAWAETAKHQVAHTGALSNSFMVYQDERESESPDCDIDMPTIKPRRRVVRKAPIVNRTSIQLLRDAELMERIVNGKYMTS